MRSCRRQRWIWFGCALLIVALASCSNCPGDASCLPYGTYVEPNNALGVASATICFDDDCRTLRPGENEDNVQSGFYRNEWINGRKLTLTIEVFDVLGSTIDKLSEQRTMDSGGCHCGVLFYDWQAGKLHRVN